MIKQIVQQQKFPYLFFTLVIIVTLARIVLLHSHVWPVNGDETQYWSWAKHLAWGYYSKPPMIAWLIALTTHFFGNGIVAMRLASPILHSITALMIFLTARHLFDEKAGLWAGLTYLLLPGVTFSSAIISTDVPLLMFWSIAFYCFIRSVETNQYRWWLGLGISLGGAMLSKYAALFFIVSMLFYFVIEKQQRHYLTKPGPYLALLIMTLILLPNIFWNAHHAFASVSAVADNANLQGDFVHPQHFLLFIASQLALFGPILFVSLIYLMVNPRIWKVAHYRLLLVFTLPVFLVMGVEALLAHAHGNWAAAMYVAASILVAAFLVQGKKIYWLLLASLLHLVVIMGFIDIKTIVQACTLNIHRSTTITNWSQQKKHIASLRQHHPSSKVLVDNRMLLTEIMYFGQVPLADTFEWNPKHTRKDQYQLFTHLGSEKGKNFLLFTYKPLPTNIIKRFMSARFVSRLSLRSLDGRLLPVYVFDLKDFKGYSNHDKKTV